MRRLSFLLLFLSLFLLIPAIGSARHFEAREAKPAPEPQMRTPGVGRDHDVIPDEKQERDMAKARAKQRWQEIRRDSEHLLEVATELKQYVDKSGENVMSLEVIKKAQEMEKLSKDLQKKMKGD